MSPRLLRAVGWGWAAVLGLLTVVVFVLVLILAKDAVLPTRIKYGLVFDAGSTHTSLYTYQWRANKENGTGIVSQVEACSVSGPGISSYADDPAGAGASLKPCLDRAMKIVPAEQQRETPTYLGATAGMRLLREENSSKAEQVLAEVSKAIGEYPVDFRGARILTGSEEGSFGWITVNYLLEALVKFSFAEKWEHPQDTEVLGALDLGGASTQITFQPGVPVEDRNTSVFFRLYGTNYSLYSHSYLCYGQSQALKMLLAALHQASSSTQIKHPCYPQGYQENITVAELYDSPCVHAPSSASPGPVLMVTGTGDPAACATAVRRLFNFTCGAQGPCGFNGVYQPPVRGQFFAFSGFYHSLHFLNLTGGQSLSLVNATIMQICNSSWKQVQELFPTASRTQLRDACTASSYILTLLLQGYKFNITTWPSIHFIQQVANVDVGWTLGYMLNLTNMIPSEPPMAVTELPRSIWIAATLLLAIMLILIFCLLTAMCCHRNSLGYEQL
ncbi:ectonucleoside triphosphate diphosphohydrolase 8-like [Haemorhous mexicanus]|uniref:ectonucleoside triphosphate diphosphohydrolase 8-like n=1 Tax=Haemorhous mexicanus TaxID=30427 RepID=UPI0028BEE3D0|nr:ectonucleoside triphosphate diphosphohydrolase 8-like [Haemorhous mexicanus]XP_059721402.1 ectonucleoside triphosphate diphosphohydrolase 8-like [Haemorhous mexicanus]